VDRIPAEVSMDSNTLMLGPQRCILPSPAADAKKAMKCPPPARLGEWRPVPIAASERIRTPMMKASDPSNGCGLQALCPTHSGGGGGTDAGEQRRQRRQRRAEGSYRPRGGVQRRGVPAFLLLVQRDPRLLLEEEGGKRRPARRYICPRPARSRHKWAEPRAIARLPPS